MSHTQRIGFQDSIGFIISNAKHEKEAEGVTVDAQFLTVTRRLKVTNKVESATRATGNKSKSLVVKKFKNSYQRLAFRKPSYFVFSLFPLFAIIFGL